MTTLAPAVAHRPFRIEHRLPPQAVFDPIWLVRCQVKILIVTDSSSGGFGDTAGFHLGQVLKVLADDPWFHVVFKVTKAHRQQSPEADVIDNFRFDQHDLDQYSQIWMFGIDRTGQGSPLSQQELRAVARFMDGGGGVFATGDHDDLGNAMCGAVPRVRSMRRWWTGAGGPNGEPVAPAQTGPNRHDTVMEFAAGGSQTDPIPQPIRPRFYSRTTGGGIIRFVQSWPHEVLCGPGGVIDFLPDHMHEGECEVPADLGQSFTFAGETFEEYPARNGLHPQPEVIAWARTRNTDGSEFGVLGAYDGHPAGLGRVLVDATWHHWFNINTLPYINASDPNHPTYTPATVAKWEEIKAYYRNVGLWLARPSVRRCIRNGGLIKTLGDYDIRITFRDLKTVPDRLGYFWQLGVFARDALGRAASQCQRTRIIVDLLIELEPPFRVDPWWPREPRLPEPPDWIALDDLENVLLGAGVHAAIEAFGRSESPQKLLDAEDGARVAEAMRKGSRLGAEALAEGMQRGFGELREAVAKLRG